jgi:glycosyltransferase involved in cell wall biosynthesis
MNILLDASAAVHQRAGIGRYTQELLTALLELAPEHTWRIFYNRAADANPHPPLNRLPGVTIATGDKPWRLRVLLAHLLRRPQDARLPADLFHATDNLLPYLRAPAVFTLFDLTHHFFPHTQASLNRWYLTLMLPRFLKTARAVIAISEQTRQDAMRLYGLPGEKITAIPLGVNTCFRPINAADIVATREKYTLPEKFILAVGTIEPRKNLAALLPMLQMDERLHLVIAGKRGWLAEDFLRQLEASGCQGRVTWLGRTPEADLPALYSAARLFAFPSLYEGFGLPVLEAMACGTPVVCANTSSLPEVAGEAALLTPTHEPRTLHAAISRLWDDDAFHAEHRASGLAHAARFTWQRTAQETLRVYQGAGSKGQTARGK